MWLLLALIGHILNAFVFLSDKAFVEKLLPSPKTLAFVAGASNVFLLVLLPRFLLPASADVVWAGIGSGALLVLALVFFYTALDRDEVSRVVPAIGGIAPVFTYGLSFILLGERLQGEFLWAFLFLVLGGLLIEFRSLRGLFSRRLLATFSLEVLVSFLFAGALVLQKYAFEGTDDFSAFLWSRVGAFLAALPLLVSPSVRAHLSFSRIREMGVRLSGLYVGSRVLAGVAPLILIAAISLGSVSLVNALQGAQYAFLFLLAVIFSRRFPQIFGEVATKSTIAEKVVALAFIVMGMALLV